MFAKGKNACSTALQPLQGPENTETRKGRNCTRRGPPCLTVKRTAKAGKPVSSPQIPLRPLSLYCVHEQLSCQTDISKGSAEGGGCTQPVTAAAWTKCLEF